MSADAFGTQRLRDAALAAWNAQPDRFREDANSEEDHGRGYYRDRVVVELAQNAADAATRVGSPGRLLLRLSTTATGGTLLAANTGAPLDAAGVASLASLRASAKRDAAPEAVGRFGVGFAAVRSVADEVTVAAPSGTVHFSLDRATELLRTRASGDLAREVAGRDGSLPVLRLPFDGPGGATAELVRPAMLPSGSLAEVLAEGWDTAVLLELRDAAAVDVVRAQLAAVDDTLLLALPGLGAIEVDDGEQQRVVRDVGARWVVAARSGTLDAALLADRPVEERGRTGWQITWAAPRPASEGSVTRTVHAPTPTDEPCTVPAVLIATFPLDPARRHVAPGPLTDELVRLAGDVWADLLAACRSRDGEPGGHAPDPLDLLPSGLPAGALDAALRDAVLQASRRVPLFTPVGGGPDLTAPDALVLDGPVGADAEALAALGAWLPNLVALAPRHRAAVRLLDLARTDLSDVVDSLPAADPARLRTLYDAFAGADSATLEELATLPVPLADGRTVRGARGLVLAEQRVTGTVLDRLSRWGVRFVHPDAAHPLLRRLGAASADAATLLEHPVLRERVLQDGTLTDEDMALDDEPAEGSDEPTGPATTVLLSLVTAALADGAHLNPAPWWGEALLPAADGEQLPARGLVLPGSSAADWFDPRVLPPVSREVVERWGDAVELIGVRTGLTVLRIGAGSGADEHLGGRLEEDDALLTEALDGWEDYLDELVRSADAPATDASATGGSATDDLPELTVIADLDAVRPQAWPEVLAALATGPGRTALVEPVRVGGGRTSPSYTAWWLRRRAALGLGRPFALPQPGWPDRDGPGLDGPDLDGPGGTRPGTAVSALLGPPPAAVAGLDREVLRVLGGIADPRDLDPDGWVDLVDALPGAPAPVDLALAVELWRGLARLAGQHGGLTLDLDRLPALVPGLGAGLVEMCPVEDVAIASAMWAQHPGIGPVLVVPASTVEAVADLLDLDLAEERGTGAVTSAGRPAPVPDVVRSVFAAAPSSWVEHEDLLVDGHRVDWWVTREGTLHAATTAGLTDALAEVIGTGQRGAIERLLLDPGARAAVLLTLAAEEEPSTGERTTP